MQTPETGEIVTPIDDPCQFNPAWRSCVAQYLFECGARSRDDLEGIFRLGGIPMTEPRNPEQNKPEKKGKSKSKAQRSKKKSEGGHTIVMPVAPFDSSAEYRCFGADEWIIGMVEVLDAMSRGEPSTKEDAGIRLAKRWYEEMDHEAAMKKRLEPLLLTGIGMDVVTLDLIGVPSAKPAIEAYERLYYNCRSDDWSLNQSGQLIQRMAMPYGPLKTFLRKYEEIDEDGFVIGDGRPLARDSDVWKAIAATMGYDALMYAWKWDRFAHGMKDKSLENMIEVSWKVAASRLLVSLYTGDISHEDAARILSAFTAQSKKISDDRNSSGDVGENDTTKALLAVMYQMAPKMVVFAADDDNAKNDEIQSRISSQMAISKTEIEDKGASVNAEVMDAQISNAIST